MKKLEFIDIKFYLVNKKIDILLNKAFLNENEKKELKYLKKQWIFIINKQEINPYKVYKIKYNESFRK
jgi:hypothetical protein